MSNRGKKSKTTTVQDQQQGSPDRQLPELRRSNTVNQLVGDVAVTTKKTLDDVTKSVLHLAGNYEAMKSLCQNYGLAAALILTMAFANYSSLDANAWMHYQQVWITSDECQELARKSCNSTIKVTNQMRLGGDGLRSSAWTQGSEFYCTDVFHEWTKDGGNPFLSYKGTDKECCSETIRCAMISSWNLEASFIAGNGAGSMLLLMTVLYATLLHIVVQGTSAELNDPGHVETVQKNLEVPFLFLHLLFFVGLGLAFFGIISVMSIRISTPNFSETSYGIGVTAGVLAVILTFVSFFHVLKVNRKINVLKKDKKSPSASKDKPTELAQELKKKEVIKKEEELEKALGELKKALEA